MSPKRKVTLLHPMNLKKKTLISYFGEGKSNLSFNTEVASLVSMLTECLPYRFRDTFRGIVAGNNISDQGDLSLAERLSQICDLVSSVPGGPHISAAHSVDPMLLGAASGDEELTNTREDVFVAEVVFNRKRRRSGGLDGTEVVPIAVTSRRELRDDRDCDFLGLIAIIPCAGVFLAPSTVNPGSWITIGISWLRIRRKDGCFAKGGYAKKLLCLHRLTFDYISGAGLPNQPLLRLRAYHMDDNVESCPLLPPNVFDGKSFECGKREQRRYYKRKYSVAASVRKRCRHYVRGALYDAGRIEKRGVFVYDPKQKGNLDMEIGVQGCREQQKGNRTKSVIYVKETTVVQVRTCTDPYTLDMVARNAKRFQSSSNVRRDTGDLGGMVAVGTHYCSFCKGGGKRMEYPVTRRARELDVVCQYVSNYMDVLHPSVCTIMKKVERDVGVLPSPALVRQGHSMTAAVDISHNLGNSTHYDVGDASVGVSIWTEETPGSTSDWFFVMPNVLVRSNDKTYSGVMFRLSHGVSISWDGRIIRHGTTIPKTDQLGHLASGTFFAAKKGLVEYGAEQTLISNDS